MILTWSRRLENRVGQIEKHEHDARPPGAVVKSSQFIDLNCLTWAQLALLRNDWPEGLHLSSSQFRRPHATVITSKLQTAFALAMDVSGI